MSAPNDPAFPRSGFEASLSASSGTDTLPQDGMTLQQYAAIKLKVPNSGIEWLDDMIRESLRNDFAAAALSGWLASYGPDAEHPTTSINRGANTAANAFKLAEQMCPEPRAKGSP